MGEREECACTGMKRRLQGKEEAEAQHTLFGVTASFFLLILY